MWEWEAKTENEVLSRPRTPRWVNNSEFFFVQNTSTIGRDKYLSDLKIFSSFENFVVFSFHFCSFKFLKKSKLISLFFPPIQISKTTSDMWFRKAHRAAVPPSGSPAERHVQLAGKCHSLRHLGQHITEAPISVSHSPSARTQVSKLTNFFEDDSLSFSNIMISNRL
jgi:hypothetical protein